MNRRFVTYVGYAICVAAGLLIAIDVLAKVLVLLLLAVGAVLVAVNGRLSRRTG